MPAPLHGQLLDAALYGDPVLLGKIEATTTQNNHDTATSFNNTGEALKGKLLVLQPDVECYVRQVDSNSGTVTADNGLHILASEKFYMQMRSNKGFLAVLPVTGSVVLRVFEMNG